MRTLIVHQPIALGHAVEDIKAMVVEKNTAILLGNDFPGATPFLSIKDLIGDPNAYLSESVCEMLTEVGVLSRFAVLTPDGKQAKLHDKSLLWEYEWSLNRDGGGEGTRTLVLSPEQLSVLSWELRNHPNFVHVSVVNDEPVTSSEEVLDSTESEEYDGSAESDVEGAWANQDAGED